MSHLPDETIVSYLDGELSDAESRRVRRHLRCCDRCGRRHERLDVASAQLSGDLEQVELPESLRRSVLLEETRGRRRARRRIVVAVAFLLAVAGGAAAAVPGSPVHRGLGQVAEALTALFEDDAPRAVEEARVESGVSTEPEEGSVEVRLLRPTEGIRVRVRVVEGPRASAWTAGARFYTAAGRIEVIEPGPGEVRVELPRAAEEARVLVGDRTLFRRVADGLELGGAVLDSSGSEYLIEVGG